jgi:nicotinamidase-related amidase
MMTRHVYLALHYQNENCHPDGAIKVGISHGAPWREERLGNAMRLMQGMRDAGIPIVHVRLAVQPDFSDVVQNTPIIRQWVGQNAWREGTWGCQWLDGFEPRDDEIVVTHTRNSVMHGCTVPDVLLGLGAEHLIFSGVSTAYVVEGSVRHATDIGYPCTVVGDACSTATQQQHFNALDALRLLADVVTVDEILATVAAR